MVSNLKRFFKLIAYPLRVNSCILLNEIQLAAWDRVDKRESRADEAERFADQLGRVYPKEATIPHCSHSSDVHAAPKIVLRILGTLQDDLVDDWCLDFLTRGEHAGAGMYNGDLCWVWCPHQQSVVPPPMITGKILARFVRKCAPEPRYLAGSRMPTATLDAPRELLPFGGRAAVQARGKNVAHVLFAGSTWVTITPINKARVEVGIPEWEGQVGVILMVLSFFIKTFCK